MCLALVAFVLCDVLYVHAELAQLAPYESVLKPDGGKLPLTAGFSEVDGTGGGDATIDARRFRAPLDSP